MEQMPGRHLGMRAVCAPSSRRVMGLRVGNQVEIAPLAQVHPSAPEEMMRVVEGVDGIG